MKISIYDKSGRCLLFGTVHHLTLNSHGDLDYTLTKIHKPCILEEDRQFCACDEKP
jgi:hypothetical protein